MQANPAFLSARERQQARKNGTLIDPPKPGREPTVPDVQCVHRSWAPVGKIRCNCANQPEAFTCDEPAVLSGYATPRLPKQPGDGSILLHDGSKVTPKDDRYPSFLPMPLKEGEKPRPCDVVVCSTCPHRVDPPAHIARLKELGIVGDHDPDTGHCDVLHVLPNASPKPDRIVVPGRCRACTVTVNRTMALDDLVDATSCGLMILYAQAVSLQLVKTCLATHPELKVWLVLQDTRSKHEDVSGLWYDLPPDLADDIAKRTKSAYEDAIQRILS